MRNKSEMSAGRHSRVDDIVKKSESNIHVSIAASARHELADSLSMLLSDTYVLYLKTQNFHWNVRGARFPVLHQLFETQYVEIAAAVDKMAERIRALGYLAPASFEEFKSLASIEEGDSKLQADEMVKRLMLDHEHMAQSFRAMFSKAERDHDIATADLFTQRMAIHEKFAWMLRATLEE